MTATEPEPRPAASDTDHPVEAIGQKARRMLLQRLDAADESEDLGTRVFGRSGLAFAHAR